MNNKIKISVIGSYPVKINNLGLFLSYYNKKKINWDNFIIKAVDDQIKAGVDIISDGQTRDSFVNIFYRKLRGCRIRDRAEVIDKIEYQKPIVLNDQIKVKKILPKDKLLIGLLAGPFTLMKSAVDLFYNDEKELAFDFANALNQEARKLEKEVDLLSIDEPFFSIEMPDYAQELIKKVRENISCQIRLHCCGDVSKIIPKLVEMPVDILSHEFKATPKLFDAFKNYCFSKKMCLGSVRSDNSYIEKVDEIVDHINLGLKVFDGNISQLAPDCGLRNLAQNIAFQKLKNLALAGEKING